MNSNSLEARPAKKRVGYKAVITIFNARNQRGAARSSRRQTQGKSSETKGRAESTFLTTNEQQPTYWRQQTNDCPDAERYQVESTVAR